MRAESYTQDISLSSVYVLTSARLSAGAVVTLQVTLPFFLWTAFTSRSYFA